MTDAEIVARRLHAQGLATSPFRAAEEVVRTLVAVQAQEYAVAKWSLGERSRGVDESAVDRAVAEGAILRTHVLRPTWHFVARSDLRWLMALSGPRVRAANAHYDGKLGLDAAICARSNDLMARAVEGGRHLPRKGLAEALARGGIPADGQRLAYLVMRAELDSVICSGAPRGKEQTYALFDERVPLAEPRDPDDALAELARRYFATRGPATVKDYRWWSGLTAAQAKRGIELAGAELERVVVGDRSYWLAPSAAPPPEPSPTAHLLQAYDEYIIAYGESRGVLDRAGLATGVTGRQMPYLHVLFIDGQLAGRWRRRVTAARMTVETQLARSVSDAEREALERVVARYGTFSALSGVLA